MDEEQPDEGDQANDGETRVRCQVDVNRHQLDVSWTKGAIFDFDSERAATRWVERQNTAVPGMLHLKSDSPGTDQLNPDFYLYYRPPANG